MSPVALVTGGAQGIGKAVCNGFLQKGYQVSVCDVKEKEGAETAKEFAKAFGADKVQFLTCDVTNEAQFEDCFKKTISSFGKIDVVVNNAGICNEKDSGWRKMVDINLNGVVCGTLLGMRYMGKDRGGAGGTVVNIASFTALDPFSTHPIYCSTKAAVNHFTRSIGCDLHFESSGVKVVAVSPGLTSTSILQDAAVNVNDEKIKEKAADLLGSIPQQQPSDLSRGLLTVVEKGENGSLWLVGDAKEPRLITLETKYS